MIFAQATFALRSPSDVWFTKTSALDVAMAKVVDFSKDVSLGVS
jgi:hypothetical protein